MGLAGAGRAEQDDVLLSGEEVELAEVEHRVAADRGLEGEVEVLERLARREPGGLDPGLATVAVAAVDLGLQQHLGEALKRPLLGAGAVGGLGARPRAFSARNRCASSLEARLTRSMRHSGPAPAPRRSARRGAHRAGP